MTGLLIIIVCVAISVFCYKQVSKRCSNKSQGKFRTSLTSTLSGVGVFIIAMLIAVPVFYSGADNVSTNTIKPTNTIESTVSSTPEIVLDHRLDNTFNNKFMPDGEKDMNVRFDSFMSELSSVSFQPDLKGQFSYTNKRDAYLYKINGNIMMVLLVNNKTSGVNYISVIIPNDSYDSIPLLREIMRSMRINATYKLVDFMDKSEKNGIAHEIIEGNEYLTQKTQAGYFISIRKS
ncbi:hypothetical protein WFM44_16825 [Yersinia enterocolitica]